MSRRVPMNPRCLAVAIGPLSKRRARPFPGKGRHARAAPQGWFVPLVFQSPRSKFPIGGPHPKARSRRKLRRIKSATRRTRQDDARRRGLQEQDWWRRRRLDGHGALRWGHQRVSSGRSDRQLTPAQEWEPKTTKLISGGCEVVFGEIGLGHSRSVPGPKYVLGGKAYGRWNGDPATEQGEVNHRGSSTAPGVHASARSSNPSCFSATAAVQGHERWELDRALAATLATPRARRRVAVLKISLLPGQLVVSPSLTSL